MRLLQAYQDLNSLFYWVRISNIPPLFEVPNNFLDIAAVAGEYIEYDEKLFVNSGKVRVRVSHEILKPFFLQKTLKLAPRVEPEISYFFENLVGKCHVCNLIYHEDDRCPSSTSIAKDTLMPKPGETKLEISSPFISFTTNQFINGTFKFQGLKTPILPAVGRSLFGKDNGNGRKPLVLRGKASNASPNNSLAIVLIDPSSSEKHVDPEPVQLKDGNKISRSPSLYSSPKKLKTLLSKLFQQPDPSMALAKKVKMPEFTTRISTKSLGMIEALSSILVPKEHPSEHAAPKKKRGRPLGSKSKNLPKTKKVTEAQELYYAYLTKPPSSSAKGKEKI
ncbi:uncharacterized protein LOC133708083 [Rosa rugosa]|uniref:uncharacterized protein LOC133708083 n=1 Tax=Rosa rugosa TaxID=74645 RepID=UPI002B40084F|nr:uncharacterized protein LOC133708083 [Rosa rugosa]